MSVDLVMAWDNDAGVADLQLCCNDLKLADTLDTAILISLFTDRLAPETETLPAGDGDRRGWWGDSFPMAESDADGSLLWLLSREKQTPAVLERARIYAREALQWLIADRVARSVDVTASYPRSAWLLIEVAVLEISGNRRTFAYTLDSNGALCACEQLT